MPTIFPRGLTTRELPSTYSGMSRFSFLVDDGEEVVLKIRTYLYEGTMLFLHGALYASGVQCSLAFYF